MKNILILYLIFSVSCIFSQSCDPMYYLCRQINCCSATCQSGESPNDPVPSWALERVGLCSDTGPYSCFAYVRAQLHGDGIVPMDCIGSNSTCVCRKYIGTTILTDQEVELIEVSSTNSNSANVVYYSGSHVAYRSNEATYISKLNDDRSIYKHILNVSQDVFGVPEHFFQYIPYLNGPFKISNPKEYSVAFRSGVSYTWALEQNGNVATMSVDPSNPSKVIVTPYSNCKGFVKLKLTLQGIGIPNSTRIQCISIEINPNSTIECSPCQITGKYNQLNSINTYTLSNGNTVFWNTTELNLDDCPNPTIFTWKKTGGTGNFYGDGKKVFIYLSTGQSITLLITAKNNAGQVISTRTVSFSRPSGWGLLSNSTNTSDLVYPNPSTGKITLQNQECTIEKIEIFEISGKQVFASQFDSNNCGPIEVNLPNSKTSSLYILKITDVEGFSSFQKVLVSDQN